jgi:two-component system, NtrC family, response regulator HupR/HoxA
VGSPSPDRRQNISRRHVRVPCLVRLGTREVWGHTLNVSTVGMHLQLPLADLSGNRPKVHADVSLRLMLPKSPPVFCEGTVVWVKVPEVPAPDATAELGVSLFEVDAGQTNPLAEFIETFQHTVVVLERDPADLALVRQALGGDYRLVCFEAPEQALAFIEDNDLAAVLIGDPLAGTNVSDLLTWCAARVPPPVARIVGSRSDPPAVMNPNADFPDVFYWLQKPYRASALQQVIRRGTEAHALALDNERLLLELEHINDRLQRENSFLKRKLEPLEDFEGIVGTSPELKQALAEVRAACAADSPVHIHGETGTGKELVARALHLGSARNTGPFIAQNCAGISESLLQSTLFGHRKGAFTGADRDHRGVFEQANGGTLFLDEVAELSKVVQGSLVRCLETGTVTPLGSTTPVKVDVRLVSATHRDLRAEAQAGRFREDLLFRLLVVPVGLPPLRERIGDAAQLAQHFLELHARHHGKHLPGFEPGVLEAFARFSWPGNVRELENEVERLVVLADDREPIPVALLSQHIRESVPLTPAPAEADPETVLVPPGLAYDDAIAHLQRALVERALGDAHGRLAVAAQILQLERSRLGKLRKRLRL